MITLLKKDKHGGRELDDYRPITLLNIVKDFGQDPNRAFAVSCRDFVRT